MVTGLLAKVYGKIMKIRNKRYDRDKHLLVKINTPIISVGNLSVGGTGKTPFVQMLSRELISLKKKPAIIGRGYKRKSKGEVIVCDGKKIIANTKEAGDEMMLLARSLNVPVIANESKVQAAITAERRFDIDCIIVDDGFQHRALNRNLDIVLIDNDTIEQPHLIPKGRLREPLESLKRADVICLTGDMKLNDYIISLAKPETLFIKVLPYQGRPYFLNGKFLSDDDRVSASKGIIPVAAIAKPHRFFEMLTKSKYKLINPISFSDHHYYNRNDFEKIRRVCSNNHINYIAVTEKDAAKLMDFSERFEHYNIKTVVFPIYLKITDGHKEFLNLIKLTIA